MCGAKSCAHTLAFMHIRNSAKMNEVPQIFLKRLMLECGLVCPPNCQNCKYFANPAIKGRNFGPTV